MKVNNKIKKIITLGFFVVLLLSACKTLKIDTGSITVDFVIDIIAYVYENKKTGELFYCRNKYDGELLDFEYKGTAEVQPGKVVECYLY